MKFALYLIVAMALTCALSAQAGPPLPFDAASVKPNNTPAQFGTGIIRALPGGRLNAQGAILKFILQNAYQVQRFQIVGGPDWIESARYDIDATAASAVTPPQVMLMLQTLLEERFKLKVHRESRELPVYDLVTAKGGVKLPAPKEGACVAVDPNSPLPPPPPPPGSGASPTPLCGTVFAAGGPAGMRLIGGAATMANLIRTLTAMLGRPIVDQTGYTDKFDLNIEFSFDQSLAGLNPPAGMPVVADSLTPSVFTALQQQLGLKLESSKGPVEVLVIDHVERPIAN